MSEAIDAPAAAHFRLYPADALMEISALTDEEAGIHFRMLCLSWQQDGLPGDLDRLARVLRIPKARFAQAWAALESFWVDDQAGKFRNPRQEEERAKLNAWRAKLSAAGKRGASKRWEP